MAGIECPRPIFGVMDITNARHCPRITPSVADGLGINLALGPLSIVAYLGDIAAEELGIETVLTKNPEYEPPRKGLPPKYEKIEKFRQQLDHLDSITENTPSQDKKEFNYE